MCCAAVSPERLFASDGRTTVLPMPTTAHDLSLRPAPLPAHARPRLRAVPPPSRRPRRAASTSAALYLIGLTLGFALAALASLPGGAALVSGQLLLAGVAAAAAAAALLRARAVARRRRRRGA